MLPEVSQRNCPAQTTTNSYVDITDENFITRYLDKVNIFVENTGGANGAKYKVLGSFDGTTFDVEIVAEQTLAFGAQATHSVTDYYLAMQIQIKAETPDSQTTVLAKFIGRN